jgi:hypothetical protein
MVLAVSETPLVPVRAHCTSPACCASGQWDASIGCCTALVHTRYYGCARCSLCFQTWRTRAEETGGCFVMSRTTTTQAGSCHQGLHGGSTLVFACAESPTMHLIFRHAVACHFFVRTWLHSRTLPEFDRGSGPNAEHAQWLLKDHPTTRPWSGIVSACRPA